ncbi:Cold shock protein CspB [Maioricimonas rarisocia]|uniref:Cold shock protein CspB n=1 Tax=Maioricimonas rarisocia TaxID=2528026 RepID=A0A517ZBB3_9PLAN|nr:HPF/RaiA family ribosome-associated protein [Maioricimonas rarisocia]QDU39784.1 Cold shock protein CspB [Maioricimonas rarisocia]
MTIPLELSFRNLDHDPVIEEEIRGYVAKLEEFFDRITSCKVIVEAPHQRHRQGNLFQVRIRLAVPRTEIVVDRASGSSPAHEDLHVAVRDAFKSARRQLQDYVRKLRGEVKSHEEPPQGRIVRLNPEDGYGFIETPDGREIYFNANSLVDVRFEQIVEGMPVRFAEVPGDQGPQATTVRCL